MADEIKGLGLDQPAAAAPAPEPAAPPAAPHRTAASAGLLPVIVAVVLALYVIVSGYFLYDQHTQIQALQKDQAAQVAKLDKLKEAHAASDARARAANEAIEEKLGITEKQLDTRAAELQRQQRASEARLAKSQEEQIKGVSGEVSNVKQDVGSAKADIAATKTDLADTKAKLERAMGDLGIQSGLIAHTRDELEILKKRGERNYFEFTLLKGKQAVGVGAIKLALKKVDVKKGKYTMNVLADDGTIEKKDKNRNEPVQFYSGKDRQLYEIVVFEMSKDRVSGYLSTPK